MTARSGVEVVKALAGSTPTAEQIIASKDATVIFSSNYDIATFCSSPTDYVVAAQTTNGEVVFSKNGGAATQDNTLNAFSPCASLSVASTSVAYASPTTGNWTAIPETQCAAENQRCVFEGTKTILYGSKERGIFTAKIATGYQWCDNNNFVDPVPRTVKACYILE